MNQSLSLRWTLLGIAGFGLATDALAQYTSWIPGPAQSLRAQYLTVNFRSLDAADTKDLSLNLGSVNPFLNGTAPHTLIGAGTGLTSTELTTFFGGNLNNVKFSVTGFDFAGPSGPNQQKILYLSDPLATSLTRKSNAAQGTALGTIDTFYANIRNNGEMYGDAAGGALLKDNTGSYTSKVGANGGWGQSELTEGFTTTSFSSPLTLHLFKLEPTASLNQPGTFIGDFTLSPSGTLTFAPVPEPASVAWAGVLGGLAVWVVRQRRKA